MFFILSKKLLCVFEIFRFRTPLSIPFLAIADFIEEADLL